MSNHYETKQVIIEDTTLRDGEQAPGIALSVEDKIAIIKALDEAGVPMIELGIARMGGQEEEFIHKATSIPLRATLIGWNRAVLDDIKCSLEIGLRAVHIGAPTSEIQLRASVGKDRAWLHNTIPELVGYAKQKGAYVSVSAEDVCRTPIEHVIEYARMVYASGADRIRLSDTLGLCNPLDYYKLVKSVVEDIGIDVQVHAHNDLGLGMGNVLAGVTGGARYVQATVNGWGERVGLVGLEVVIVGLKRLLGIETGVDTTQLVALSTLVAKSFNREVPAWQPVVGKDTFTHESGIHVAGSIADVTAFEPFPSDWIGRKHSYVVGKHSGSRAIQYMLGSAGIDANREESARLVPIVRQHAIRHKGSLSLQELVDLYQDYVKGNNQDG